MSLTDPTAPFIITAINFPHEGNVEISFIEKRDQGDHAGLMKTIFIDVHGAKCVDSYDDLVEAAHDIVEAGLLTIRNPEPNLDPRKRFKGKVAPLEIDPDDAYVED